MGNLPCAVAEEAKSMGYRVVAIALKPPADDSLKGVADEFHKISIGRFGGLLSLLKKCSIRDVVLAGKVPKSLLYKNKVNIIPDLKTLKMLFSLKDRSDDTIMDTVVRELEKNGIRIHNTTDFTKNLLAPAGVLTGKEPAKTEIDDIEFGWKIAKKIGRLDIGQTIVVKNRAVMAVEAIEGSDEAIKRGANLAKGDAVVIKVSKPQQDMRFDVPAVGLDTLSTMKKASASVLALEAGKCIIIEKEKFLKEADRSAIAVIGMKGDEL